jgi:hypothetical protein
VHGQVDAACQRLRLLATWIGSQANTQLKVNLTDRLFELLHYAEESVDYLVNYARRHRDKLRLCRIKDFSGKNLQRNQRSFVTKNP